MIISQPSAINKQPYTAPIAQKQASKASMTLNTPKTIKDAQKPISGNGTTASEIIKDFSMEKAVIYSEILKPKWEEFQ